MLVTADAGEGLIRLHVRQTAHGLNGHPALVQRLEEHGYSARYVEVSRAVRFDRDGTQYELAGILARHTQHRVVHVWLDFRWHRNDPNPLDRSTFEFFHPQVNVLKQETAFLRSVPVDQVRAVRRMRA